MITIDNYIPEIQSAVHIITLNSQLSTLNFQLSILN